MYSMLVSTWVCKRFLSMSPDAFGLKNKHKVSEMLPELYAWFFEGALGASFLILVALETGLKIERLSRSPWGSGMAPQNKRAQGWVNPGLRE